MKFRKTALLTATLAVALLLLSAVPSSDTPQGRYIDTYAAIAVREMYRSGVPASITLAQGLLESRYGQSELASKGNNHFGIKCHDWKGRKQYADDDRKAECFRVYDSAEESFRDHSDFLRYRDRYKSLFEYDPGDYRSWAYGLKKAGYATDPAYPQKLIKLIEDYDLARFDRMVPEDFSGLDSGRESAPEQIGAQPRKRQKSRQAEVREPRKSSKASRRNDAERRTASASRTSNRTVAETLPESPLSLEQPRRLGPDESYRFSLSRQAYSQNGVPFIYAMKGETIESIAAANNLFVKELIKFNDMRPGQRLEAGEIVYLQAKKKSTRKGLDKYIADSDGESLRNVSQRFGVKLSELCKKNNLSPSHVLKEGDTVILR